MATLSVGPGKPFATIAAAIAAAQPGDTVAVQSGTYLNDVATIKSAITLTAVGGQVTILSTATAATAAALLTVAAPPGAPVAITGFTLSGMRTASGTAAGLLVQSGAVTVQNCLFSNNQNGLLATGNPATTLTIQSSEFAHNGNNDGFSGNLNVAAIKSLTMSGSYVHDAQGGDEVRSLAATTTITGTRIQDNAGTARYALEAQNGGAVTLSNDTIEKGAASTVPAAIAFGGGTLQPGSTLSLSNDTIVSDRPAATLLQNQSTAIASIAASTAYGVATIATGPAITFADTVAPTRPATPTTPLVTPPDTPVAPISYGRAGAVIASGRILAVGPGQQFATLAAALAASRDGDTIQVAAGTYLNDTATISTKVIIEGVGGLARFVDTTAPANGLAQFVTTTDVTFRNIEIFGADTVGGAAAAILDKSGNLTLVDSDFHDNQAGIVATSTTSGAGSVGIFDTEIAANGAPNGQSANVVIGAIGTLTMQNDLVMAALSGPEITSTADNTTLDQDRIAQAPGNPAPVLALPTIGAVTITNTAIEKAASSTPAPIIQLGTPGAPAATLPGSTVTLADDVLISDQLAAPTTFVADASPAAAQVTATSLTYVGGAPGSTQLASGTNTLPTTTTGLTVDTAAPDNAPATTTTTTIPLTTATTPPGAPQPGQLVLDISEAAYHGDAQFTLAIDGAQVAGTLTATASHAAGQTEQFTIAGPFAPGPHTVAVALVNSLGTGAAARTLTIDALRFNGVDENASDTLAANGTALFTTGPVAAPTQVAISLSETSAANDALAFITIDGKVQGGVQSIAAPHAAGQTQKLAFLLNLAPGPHTIGATILNPASNPGATPRTLFVDSVDVGATHYAAAAAQVGPGGACVASVPSTPSVFAFTLAPPPAANGALFVTSGLPELFTPPPHP